MTKKSIVKTILAVFSLMILFNIGALAQKTDCSKMTEADIVKAIYDKIKTTKYDDQIIHINVRVKANVVTLEGWATTKNVRKEIEKIAKKIKCVKKVVNKLTVGIGGGCGPGMKKCGAICIPDEETCNICLARACR